MNITYFGGAAFELKNRQGEVLTEPLKINGFAITGPGEYEVGGIYSETIDGISLLSFEEMNIAYLNRRKKPLSEEEIEKLSNVDILFLPIGGGEVFSVKEALDVAAKIEPKVLVPMLYQEKDLTEFCKEEGICYQPQEIFKVTRSTLPQEERQVIILQPKTK